MVISEKKCGIHVQVVEFWHMKSAADSAHLMVVCVTAALEPFSFLKTIFVYG
jgi:hypothetical protein